MINWGLIGCGAVTEVKSGPAYNVSGKSHLVGVTSRTLASATDYASRHNVLKVFETPSAMINSSSIDAVYIATPPSSHLKLALSVAQARKPCCIEKPISINHAEAIAIAKAFSDNGIPLFIAYYRRSLPRFQAIKSWILDGKIGDVRHIHWSLTRRPTKNDINHSFGWRTEPQEAPGGYFDDLACHGLDLFDFYFGPIMAANGQTLNQQKLYSVPDSFSGTWLHETGVTGSGYWNFASFERSDEVRVIGSHGKITFSMFADESIKCITAGGIEKLDIKHPKHLHKFHVENIISHLEGHSTHPSTGESAMRTAWVCEQILGSRNSSAKH